MKMDCSKLTAACSRIIVDGDPGAGKTTLAGKIANDLAYKVISFDDYLPGDFEGEPKPYVDQIGYDALQKEILASEEKIVIEGVLALKVLAKLNVRQDYHIFMKRYDGDIGWVFGQYLGERSRPPRDKFWQEIVEYYKELKPFDICNLLLSRDILTRDACQPVETE